MVTFTILLSIQYPAYIYYPVPASIYWYGPSIAQPDSVLQNYLFLYCTYIVLVCYYLTKGDAHPWVYLHLTDFHGLFPLKEYDFRFLLP